MTKFTGYEIKKYRGKTPVFVAVPIGNGQVEFFCPFCVKYHRHGWAGGDFEGSRTADCEYGNGSPLHETNYILITEKHSRSKVLSR